MPVREHRTAADGGLPTGSDVVVVGGGISGTATAYDLSAAGVEVTLLEQFDLNTEASGRNAGSLHGQIQFEPFRTRAAGWAESFIPALRFLGDSVAIWRELSTELGVDLEVSLGGGLLVADSDEQARQIAAKVELERAHGVAAELITGAALRERAPYLSDRIMAAEFCATEGKANPLLAAPAFARAAIRQGARVHTGVRVERIEPRGHGFRVISNAGAMDCAKLVLVAGSRLPELTAMLGAAVPILDEPVQVHATEPVAPVIPHLVYYAGGRLTLKQARAGTVLIGGGWPAQRDAQDGRPYPSLASLRANLDIALRVAPWLGGVNVIRAWAGVGHGTPDLLPLIGELPCSPGAFVGLFPHMGLTAGPLIGQVLSALVRGADPGRDLSPFRSDRFAR